MTLPDKKDRACFTEDGRYLHLFFSSDQHEHYDEARKLCAGCEAQPQCLDHALTNREDDGFWGGKSPRERRVIIRKQQKRARERRAS